MIFNTYRRRILTDLLRAFVVPSAVLAVNLHFFGLRLGQWTIPIYTAFLILWTTLRNTLVGIAHSREARQLGATSIPRVQGKWPGNFDILLRMIMAFKTTYVLDVYLGLFQEYQSTTLNLRILWVDQIITMDQEHSKFILATGFDSFWRGKAQKERMESFLGSGIFNRDDEEWKAHRMLARPFFARERISDFDIFERYTSRTLSIMRSITSTGSPCEVQDLYGRFTLDAASEFLFGHNLDTLSASLPIPGDQAIGAKGSATHDGWGSFAQAFEMSQQVITRRGRLGYFWPLFELFRDNSAKHVRAIHRWMDPLVAQAVEDKRRREDTKLTSPIGDKSFLQHLADSTDDADKIRDQLLSMLLASRDTTASLLTSVTYFMAIHPHVARKLRAEVLEHCGISGAPTYERIRSLKYMRAVINECLRLFPPVPLNVRESRSMPLKLPPSDPTYSGGPHRLYMPGNTSIMYLPLLTQRNPALWGPDADVFDPERWIDAKRLAKFTSNPAMYAPFSAGPRICLGQNYALNEASYFLVRLLQQFDTFTLAKDAQPKASLPPLEWRARQGRQAFEQLWPAAALTLYVKGGLWVRLGKAA